jgi:hypothetical protein
MDTAKSTSPHPGFKFNWFQTRLDHMSLIK